MTISNCFHVNKVQLEYKYTDEYIDFILKKIIYEKKVASDNDVIEELLTIYDEELLKKSVIKNRCMMIYGEKSKGKYILTEKITSDMVLYNSLLSTYNDIYRLESYLLFNSLTLNIDTYDKFYRQIIIFLSLKSSINGSSKDENLVYIHNYLINFDINYRKLSININNIKKNYYSLLLFQIFEFDSVEQKLLIKNDINTIGDLLEQNTYTLLLLFSMNLDKNLKILEGFSVAIKELVENIFTEIEQKNLEIIKKRNGYVDGKCKTLEEIGKEKNVTRERIRQLEAKTIRTIKKIALNNQNILTSFYNSELGKKNPYINIDKISKKYNDEFVSNILMLFQYGTLNLVYDKDYQIIYDKVSNNIKNMVDSVIDKIGTVADGNELEKSDSFTINVIKNNYKKISDILYLKKGCAYRELYLDIIEEMYPKGYRSGNSDDYYNFKKIVEERYQISEDIPAPHSLEAMLGRGDFILRDRGTYIPKKYSVILEEEMIDKILTFVSENEFTYYNGIYEKFSSELNKVGIDNRYYLKGCLDEHLPVDMKKARDYIIYANSKITPYDIVLNKIRQFDSRFSQNELMALFPGVRDYTIQNLLYSEAENGLIWISTNEFIYIDKYKIEEETKLELKKFIDTLFTSLNSNLLTSKKIYAKLKFTNKELFNSLELTNGHFELFSIIKNLYNDYYYSRPYIFNEESTYNTRSTIIQNYVKQFDYFDYKMILDYQSKLNLGVLYSYLEFMENMSDEFVQIDVDQMIKISKMNLSNDTINSIKKSLDLILENFEVINTLKFNGYSLLPKISYTWNKYLLIGIIRSYLSEYYEIVNTEKTYTNTDFEVRRMKYE